MKYGALVVTPLKKRESSFINIGDMIQTMAVLDLYKEMGVNNDDIVLIDFNNVNEYKGEYILLPININLSLNWIVDIFPLPYNIIPVFLGLSFFAAEKIPNDMIDYFRRYEPIGCRDEATMNMLRASGVLAYMFGCVTSVLPRRETKGSKIFLVDVPDSFVEYAKEFIEANKEDVVYLSHITNEGNVYSPKGALMIAEERMDLYKKEARLVISSRLHCICPCVASGIPVIPVTDNISPRMGFLDKYIHYFTPKNYNKINWEGINIDIEPLKRMMRELAIHKINKAVKLYRDEADLSYIYETRDKSEYNNYYREKLLHVLNDKRLRKYVIWGTGQVGIGVYNVVQSLYPEAECVSAVDSYCTGKFYGREIENPLVLEKKYEDSFVIVATYSGLEAAKDFLDNIGKKQDRDYICLGTSVG